MVINRDLVPSIPVNVYNVLGNSYSFSHVGNEVWGTYFSSGKSSQPQPTKVSAAKGQYIP